MRAFAIVPVLFSLVAHGSGVRLPASLNEDHVKIFKTDGSKQCGMAKPITVEKMSEELQGITIFSKKSQGDGMMHIQACGAATGQINVYEISKTDLATAESKGFKVLAEKKPTNAGGKEKK